MNNPLTDGPPAGTTGGPRALHAYGVTVSRPLVPADRETTTLAAVLVNAMARSGLRPQPGDVLAVSSKVVALFEGRTVRLEEVRPSWRARALGKLFTKDPRKLELMFEDAGAPLLVPIRFLSRRRETRRVTEDLAADGFSVASGAHRLERFEFYQSLHATLLNEAGIDIMNSPDGYVTRLPVDPCASARRLRDELRETTGIDLPVVVTDTYSPIGRVGTLDLAIGYSGLDPVERKLFSRDLFGDLRPGDANLVVDTIAAMAGGVMGQTTEMTPAAIVRGIATRPEREDPARPGMAQLAYPRRTATLGVMLSAVATVLYQIAWLFTWPLKRRTS
ncbi:MAG: coenzyme F420-0:L-glutamate ligase [Candidatus Bipolaricaulota bacterium]